MYWALLGLLAGTGPPASRAVPPAIAVMVAAQDLAKVHPDDQKTQRYLFDPYPSATRASVYNLHWNLVSREGEMQKLVRVRPWLYRIDLADFRLDAGVWENAAGQDPYFHRAVKLKRDTSFARYWPGGRDTKTGKFFSRKSYTAFRKKGALVSVHAAHLPAVELDYLRKTTYSEAPLLRADWLLAQSARQQNALGRADAGLGYYDFLALKNLADYVKLVDLDVKNVGKTSPFGREFRSALEQSGVSPNNRQIVRFPSRGGGGWVTIDTAKQKGDGIALRNLRPGEFSRKQQAQEWITPLPNGLPAYFTGDQDGKRADVVPGDKFGLHDDSPLNESRRRAIDPMISCISCHEGKVLKDFKDDVRAMNRPGTWLGLGTKKKKVDREFRRLYLSDVYFYLARDQRDYARAFGLATGGLEVGVAVRAYCRTFHAYSTDVVTHEMAARELGVSTRVWVNALRWYARPQGETYRLADVPLSRYLMKKPLPLSRLTFEDSYSLAQDILAGYGLYLLKEGK